ncbi:MAG: aldehyde dehydrogenase family protein, partial [Fidelibacterota bacterium]
AHLILGGDYATGKDLDNGTFYQPTIFTEVVPGMKIHDEEIFGPVLSVLRATDLEDAIELLNATEYGLSSSIYTRDVNAAFTAIRDIQAGITYINGPTIGAECHMPFGGVKNTGNGHREGGEAVYEFFSEPKTIYVDYSGRLQRAQIDNR